MTINRPRIQTNAVTSYQEGSISWRKLQDCTDVAELRWREKIPGSSPNPAKLKWKKCFKSLRGVTVKQAQQELDAILAEVNARNGLTNAVPAPTRRTMQSLIENEWVAYTVKQKMRPSTLNGYKSALDRIMEAFGPMPLADITASHVSTFMADLAKCNLSGKTQKNHYDLLRCLFDLAFTYDYIAISPVKPKLHRPSVEKKEKVVLAPDQWRTFFLSLPESGPWRCALLILLTTGMRQGELLGLRWQDIEWERRIITKRHVWEPKTKQLLPGLKTSKKTNKLSHEVGMSELMVHVLTDHLSKSQRWTEPADFVFVSQYDRSAPWHPDTM